MGTSTLHLNNPVPSNGAVAASLGGRHTVTATLSGVGAISCKVQAWASVDGTDSRMIGAPVVISGTTTVSQTLTFNALDVTQFWLAVVEITPACTFTATVENSGDVQFRGAVLGAGGISVYSDFTTMADGDIPAVHNSPRLPMRTKYPSAYGSVPLIVAGGRMKSQTENAGLTVCYTETDLLGDVTEIGADFSFKSNGGAASTIALCIWGDASLVDTYVAGGRIPTTGCHLIIQRDSWTYQVWEPSGANTALRTVAFGVMPNVPTDGSIYRVSVTFDKDTATISFPGYGYSVQVSDPAIYTMGRRYACWETYQSTSTADQPQYARIWASSIPQAVATRNRAAWKSPVFAKKSATDGNYAIVPSTHTEIDAATYCDFVVPPSGKVLLEYTCLLNQAAAGYVMFFLASTTVAGADWNYPLEQPSDAIYHGLITVRAVVSGLKPGELRRFRPRAFSSATANASIVRSAAGGINPILTATQL